MRNKWVKVFAPATIANLSAGFDVLGVALDMPGDFVTAKKSKSEQFQFTVETEHLNVPTSHDKNIAAYVALLMLQELNIPFGVEMILHKKMPIGSGMGSSAASSVAAAFAVNALLEKPLAKKELLRFVIEGERKASGTPHADNVAPALLGGACIIRNDKPLDVVAFPVDKAVTWVVLSPHAVLTTEKSRSVLPKTLPIETATLQMGNVSAAIVGLMQGNAEILQSSMIDHIAEPCRKTLVPAYAEIKTAALNAGALACGISGSGPSMFALTLEPDKAGPIAMAMTTTLREVEALESFAYVSKTNLHGARIVTSSKNEI